MMKVKASGRATNIDDRARNWGEGVKTTGRAYKLLGVGQKFTGWKMRSELYLKEMSEDTTTDIFIMSDIYDVLVNPKTVKKIKESEDSVKDYIISTFQSFEKPIVIGAEKICSHNCSQFSFQNFVSGIFGNDNRYPNAGLIIGYREPLITLYQHLAKFPNDQIEVGNLVSKYPRIFSLDTHSKLFYNFFVSPDDKRFGTALFVHFPGQNFSAAARVAYNKLANTPISSTTQASQIITFCIIIVWIIVFLALMYLIRIKQ